MFTYRNSDPSITTDDRYDALIHRFTSIAEVPWMDFSKMVGQKLRIIVQSSPDALPLDVLYVPRESPNLLVGFHGYLNQSNMELPVFQFLRSFNSTRSESFLLISDSTLLQDTTIGIGWTFGSIEQDLSLEYSNLINQLQRQAGYNTTILAGHSAGGFSAVRIGLPVDNSVSVVMNGQFDIGIHRKWEVSKIRRSIAPQIKSDDDFISDFPERFDLRHTFPSRGRNSRVCWFAQFDDPLSIQEYRHFPSYTEYLGIPPEGGISSQGDLGIITHYSHKPGNPHGVPGTVVPFIEAAMGEPISMDIGIEFDLFPKGTFNTEQSVAQSSVALSSKEAPAE